MSKWRIGLQARTIGCTLVVQIVVGMSGLAPAEERSSRGLYLMDIDGGNLRALDLDPSRSYGSPAWSRDGKRIVFDAWPSQATFSVSRIYTFELQGGKLHDLGPGAMPTWSPDDKQIGCHVYQDPRGIVIMDANGMGRELLVPGVGCPRWSPDGTLIAHVNWGSNISVIDTLSGKIRTCLPNGLHPSIGMQWSPDGKQIAFRNDKAPQHYQLIVARLSEDRFTDDSLTLEEAAHMGANVDWSADGKYVVFNMRSRQQEWNQLYRVQVQADAEPELLPGQLSGRHNIEPAVSPDGKQILFVSEFVD